MRIVSTDSSVFIFLDLLSTFFSWLSFTLHQVKCPSSRRGFCRWCPWCPWWCPSSERGFCRWCPCRCPSSQRGFVQLQSCRWCPCCPWWCPSSERGSLQLRCCRPPFSSETSSSANSRPRPQKPGLGNQLDDNLYIELKLNQPFNPSNVPFNSKPGLTLPRQGTSCQYHNSYLDLAV